MKAMPALSLVQQCEGLDGPTQTSNTESPASVPKCTAWQAKPALTPTVRTQKALALDYLLHYGRTNGSRQVGTVFPASFKILPAKRNN